MSEYLQPLHDNVVIQVAEKVTNYSGVYVPEHIAQAPRHGVVVAVGPGRRERLTGELVAMTVQPGDRVVFGEYGGQPLELGGRHFVMMREDAIFGIIRNG